MSTKPIETLTANRQDAMQQMTERERFEVFLLELEGLLARPEQDEDSYQDLLERHPIVFRALGYQAWVPKPTLSTAERAFEPDFLVQGADGTWEVFELKRPDTAVVRPREPRRQLYAEFDSYVAQCTEYARFFLDAAHRAQVRDRHRIDVQESVPSTLVAGRSNSVDVRVAHELLHRREGPIKLRTFDDLRLAVVNARDLACGSRDRLSGLSMHMVIRFGEVAGDANHIVRVVDPTSGRQVCISLDSDHVLRLTLRGADRHDCLAQVSAEKWGGVGSNWQYLSIDVASIDERTLVSIELNGRWFCDRVLDRVSWEFAESSVLEVGADLRFDGKCSFDLAETCILKDTTALDERLRLRRYFLSRAAMVGDYVEFRGSASMTSNHGVGADLQRERRDHSLHATTTTADRPIFRKGPPGA